MSSNFKRVDRIAGLMQRCLSEIIYKELKDPRMPSLVTISTVKVTRDLSHAKVYFTVLAEEPKAVARILNSASGFLRSALAKVIDLRTVPELHFIYDESVEYGRRLSKLIDAVNDDLPEDESSTDE